MERTGEPEESPVGWWAGGRLTHPHLSEAALAQLDFQSQRLPGDLPGVLGQALCLWLGCGAHGGESVAQAVSMFWGGRESGLRGAPGEGAHYMV